MVKAVANAKGGVHFGPPDGVAQERLVEVDQRIGLASLESSTNSIIDVGRIVLRAMNPLVGAIAS